MARIKSFAAPSPWRILDDVLSATAILPAPKRKEGIERSLSWFRYRLLRAFSDNIVSSRSKRAFSFKH